MTRNTGADDAGYTLVELLVVVILLGIIGGIVATTAIGGMRTSRQAQNRASSAEAIQAQLERMARDIRVADPIRAASSTSLTVDDYRNSTSCVRNTWAVSSGNLVQTSVTYASWSSCSAYPSGATPTSTVTRTLLTSLDTSSTSLFTYGDAANTTLASPTPSQIYNVRISITQSGLESRAGVTFATSVGVRNATLS